MKHRKTLLLNSDYSPISIIPVRRAFILNEKGRVEIVCPYEDDFIHSSSGQNYSVPAVVRLLEYIKKRRKRPLFNKKNIFIRDNMTCQYCGRFFAAHELTYDHVIPKCRYPRELHHTSTHWENIVTACIRCNNRKGDRTPEQAGMKLLKQPHKPSDMNIIIGLCPWEDKPAEWEPYLC